MGLTARNTDEGAGTLRKGPGPFVVGILNVTPDSFSDGGDFLDPEAAAEHAAASITETMRGSPRSAVTSLTRLAPASRAAVAVPAR